MLAATTEAVSSKLTSEKDAATTAKLQKSAKAFFEKNFERLQLYSNGLNYTSIIRNEKKKLLKKFQFFLNLMYKGATIV